MLEPAVQLKRWWNREDLFLLVLLGVFFLLPGLHRIPLFDRDEPRFAVASRTMMQSGDYIVPRFNGQLRPDKPPLVYWLMNAGYRLTGGPSELGARLPSAVCGTLTLLVVYFMVGSRFGRLTGFLAAMMLGTASLFLVEARLATADATMLLAIVGCMACAWQAWDAAAGPSNGRLPRADYLLDRSGDRAPMMLDHLPAAGRRSMPLVLALVFWVSLAAGTLAKGVPLAFVLVPMVALSIFTGTLPGELRRWRGQVHLSSRRAGMALTIAIAATVYLLTVGAFLPWSRTWAAILGFLLIVMILTPRLPGILVRCVWGGNWRWWSQLRPLLGVPLLVALVGWWVLWAGVATDWQLIRDMVGNHFLNRSAGPLLRAMGIHLLDTAPAAGPGHDPMKAYGQPPGFYLLTVWATFWPWSILIVPAAYHAIRRIRGKTPLAIDPRPYQFLVAWIIPMWILLEFARGKLLHYPLPLFVPLAILCADALVQSWHRLTDVLAAPWFAAMRWITLLVWCGMGVGVIVAAQWLDDGDWIWRCVPFGAALIATGLVSSWTWGRPSWPYVLVLCWGGSLLLANTLILSDLPQLQVSRRVGAQMAARLKDRPDLRLGVCGYEEATLIFYAGHDIRRFDLSGLLAQVPFAPQRNAAEEPWLLAVDAPTLRELDARGLRYTLIPRVDLSESLQMDAYQTSGLNVARFRPVTVTVISNILPQEPESEDPPSDLSPPQ